DSCAPSRHLLEMPGMRLFACEGALAPIRSIAQVRALKTDPFKGYNLLAGHEASPLLATILARLGAGR
ncbi:MAG: hypothetical protein RIG84_08085, partial [Roseovarius sp.]